MFGRPPWMNVEPIANVLNQKEYTYIIVLGGIRSRSYNIPGVYKEQSLDHAAEILRTKDER
jgi:hypothetical protein